MYLTTLDPFTRDFDRIVRRAFGPGTVGAGYAPALPMDSVRRDGELVLRFDVPGVDPEKIDVTVDKGVLTVSATREETTTEGESPIVRGGELEATLYFFGYPGQEEELELTLNHDGRSYELGTAYGHIAVSVDDLGETLAQLHDQGIDAEREPYRVREGGSLIAFVQDPDGYRVELIDLHADDQGPLTIHSVYLKYLLPMMCEIQWWEFAA